MKSHSRITTPRAPQANQTTETNASTSGSRSDLDSLVDVLHSMRSGRISVSTLEALIHLRFVRGQEMMLKELAEAVGLTTSAITGVADAMERLGFAKRMWNEMDRRQTWIGLTPEGVTFVDLIQSMLARTLAGRSSGSESAARK